MHVLLKFYYSRPNSPRKYVFCKYLLESYCFCFKHNTAKCVVSTCHLAIKDHVWLVNGNNILNLHCKMMLRNNLKLSF